MLIQDIIGDDPVRKQKYEDKIKGYNFTNGIPKDYVFIKLNDSLSDDRRNYISNGIRAYFKDDLTILVDRKVLLRSVTNSLALF